MTKKTADQNDVKAEDDKAETSQPKVKHQDAPRGQTFSGRGTETKK